MTRQLTIVDKDGVEHTVNGISGDMFKHIHAVHLVNNCIENNLDLSNYSKSLNPNRISSNQLLEYINNSKKRMKKLGLLLTH